MSYREENDQVVLTMSKIDYERVLMCLGAAAGLAIQGKGPLNSRVVFELTNRLNEGNPHYTPYQVEARDHD